MPCSCGHAVCECGEMCYCCQIDCYCPHCSHLRLKLKAQCDCGGRGMCPYNPKPEDYHALRIRRKALDKRKKMRTFGRDAQQGCSTASRRCAHGTSHTPPRESPRFDDELIFQMDDIDTSPEVPTNTNAETKSRICLARSHFSSNTNVSDTPFEQRQPPSRVGRCYHHSADSDHLKWTDSTKCKLPISVPREKSNVTGLHLRESRDREMSVTNQNVGCSHDNFDKNVPEIEELLKLGIEQLRNPAITDCNRTELLEREIPSTTEDVPGCSDHNPTTKISKPEESKAMEQLPEHKLDATDLKWAESHESEMMITKDIPECSNDRKYVSKQEESQITDSAFYAVSSSADEYARHSLPSTLNSGDSQSSNFQVSSRSPTHQLLISVPPISDLPQTTEAQPTDQKTSTVLCTSETSSTSNLSKLETLRISDSHEINKSRTSSESSSSIEIIPESMINESRYYTFHGEPGIPSFSVAPPQLNNTVMQADSSEPGTFQTSNSLKLSVRQRTASESDSSIEVISREQDNENSEDEAPTNKSPKKK